MALHPLPTTLDTDPLMHAFRHVSAEEVLLRLLVQLIVILLAARLFAGLLRRFRQPGVVGEIVAGLVLGPSVLGRWFPGIADAIFHPPLEGLTPELSAALFGQVLTILSELGLVFLLFLIGLEFDFSHLRWHGRSALAISVSGVIVPFMLGIALSWFMHPRVAADIPAPGFMLFLGTALSITAIPVLGRIMIELGITRTRLGTITISAAAVDDATGWILLASVAAIVRANFHPGHTLLMLAETLAFGLVMVFVVRPLLRPWVRRALRRSDGEISLNTLAGLLALIFGCAIVTSLIGIFAVFGAFLLGAVLSGEHEFRLAVGRRFRDFVSCFFLPIFFTYTGLRTDVGSLDSWELWLLCALVLAAAIVGKWGGCSLAARLSGLSGREAACVGAMMNCRGLMALIVVNLGRELGVIPNGVFCMLVLMAVGTTIVTTPLLLSSMPGTELEPWIRQSGFLGPRPPAPTAVQEEPFSAV
jgi:Kef-type K+ transport system membrane component KefB